MVLGPLKNFIKRKETLIASKPLVEGLEDGRVRLKKPQETWNEFLKLISGSESLVLDAVDGTKVIAKAKKVFLAGIDRDFGRGGANEPGPATLETVPSICEIVKDATFSKIFGSLSADVKNLCFTQHQIINFVEKYPDWLRPDGYATFFLFPARDHFFVADVRVFSARSFLVYLCRLGYSRIWLAHRHWVVVPQLAV